MAPPKKVAANPQAASEKVVMLALEPLKHDGQEAKPGDQFLALADDVEALIEAKLAEPAPAAEEQK